LEVLGVDGKIVWKRDLAVLGYETAELIYLVQEWVWWHALLKAVMYFPAALNAEFLDNTKDWHFSTRNPSHESCCDFIFLFILFLRQ